MRRGGIIIISLLALVGGLVAGVILVLTGSLFLGGSALGLLGGPTPTPPPTPTLVVKTGPTVLNAIKAEAKLQTITMNIATDTDVTRVSGIRGICTHSLTYLGYYDVKAGVDLARVTPDKIQVTKDGFPDDARVTITLPQAELLGIERDEVHSRTVAEQKPSTLIPGCEDPGAAMLQEAQQKTRARAQSLALDREILRLAEEKASQEIERILRNAGYKNVVIRISRGE